MLEYLVIDHGDVEGGEDGDETYQDGYGQEFVAVV